MNRYTLNRQYPIQNTSQKINEILVHRPNHNGTHSARKVRILESLFDFIEKKGSEEAKKELFHLSESQRLNLKLCTYLMRSGRVDESQSKGSLDNHYLRAALIYDEYAKQLKLSEEDRQWGKNIIANACLPKELVDKEFISEPKNYFAYILLSTVHDLDLVRCFSGSYFDENVKPLIQERMSFMSAQDPLDLNFELLIDFAKKLCGATGSPIYYDRIEMQKNLFAECSIEGDVCWEKVQSVALPQWM